MHDIRFGVDLPRDPKPERSTSDPLVIGYIGQIAPHKGVDLLVDSFAALGSVSAELHIFGPEDQDPHYMAKIRRAADGRAVRFRGTFPKEKIAGVLEELDLLAIPSRWYENSPLVLLNALASHTPVLISDVAGMTEFVEHGMNGFIFERGDLADLSRTLREIVAAPDSVRAMSQTTEYPRTTRTMVEDVLPIYRKVRGSK
jgi:glycosyltransferase involved in cell wall biosynthesis